MHPLKVELVYLDKYFTLLILLQSNSDIEQLKKNILVSLFFVLLEDNQNLHIQTLFINIIFVVLQHKTKINRM